MNRLSVSHIHKHTYVLSLLSTIPSAYNLSSADVALLYNHWTVNCQVHSTTLKRSYSNNVYPFTESVQMYVSLWYITLYSRCYEWCVPLCNQLMECSVTIKYITFNKTSQFHIQTMNPPQLKRCINVSRCYISHTIQCQMCAFV